MFHAEPTIVYTLVVTDFKLPLLKCLRCGHEWHPRAEKAPVCCAGCKSPYWQIPRGTPRNLIRRMKIKLREPEVKRDFDFGA